MIRGAFIAAPANDDPVIKIPHAAPITDKNQERVGDGKHRADDEIRLPRQKSTGDPFHQHH